MLVQNVSIATCAISHYDVKIYNSPVESQYTVTNVDIYIDILIGVHKYLI